MGDWALGIEKRQILPAPNPQRGPRVPRLRGGAGGGVLEDYCKRSIVQKIMIIV